jgi:4-diphosphocytidyl-2-C-methyl-D-erythritol kinase
MHVVSQQDRVVVQAPAKVNLFLEVLHKRSDGFHEIASVLQEISLCDELSFGPRGEGFRLQSSYPGLPRGNNNLIIRAAEALAEKLRETRGAEIMVTKRIPVGAGLGGASSDAAATLVGLARLWGRQVSSEELFELANSLGSDVPFFLHGGTALCQGRGEMVTPLDFRRQLHLVLVCPRVEASTRAVYENLVLGLTKSGKEIQYFLEVLERGTVQELGMSLFNRLERAALELYPSLRRARQALEEQGAAGVSLSGSGSAYFGLCHDKEEAERIRGRLSAPDVGEVLVVESRP